MPCLSFVIETKSLKKIDRLIEKALRRLFFLTCWNLSKTKMPHPIKSIAVVADGADWVLGWESRECIKACHRIGLTTVPSWHRFFRKDVATFHLSQFDIANYPWTKFPHPSGFAWFHGFPHEGTEFIALWEALQKNLNSIACLQVTNHKMKQELLGIGVPEKKIFNIPIGINTEIFWPQTSSSRCHFRRQYKIPEGSFVIGSFQKDGIGWGAGKKPKLIKGPDILIEALRRTKNLIPNVFVLLSGPSRGFVIEKLKDAKIPFRHVFISNYPQIAELYQCLDAYLITSRIEGGPKAILESMASMVPIISSPVGQAEEIIQDQITGLLCPVGNIESYVQAMTWVNKNPSKAQILKERAYSACHKYDYVAMTKLYENMLKSLTWQ